MSRSYNYAGMTCGTVNLHFTQEEMVALELRNSLALVATLGAGLLAGILVGTGMAAFTAKALPSTAWVTRFQLEDRLFTKAMPPLMLGTLLALVAASVLSRGASRLIFFTSIVLTVLVLVVTVAFEVPLNKEIQSWTAAAPPLHWQRIRDLWLQRHLLRTIAAGFAFVAALIGLTFR